MRNKMKIYSGKNKKRVGDAQKKEALVERYIWICDMACVLYFLILYL